MNKKTNMAETILDTAQTLVQECGFNGFSYAHIAGKVGIRTASIHYHFPSKEDLGEALIARYTENFHAAAAWIETGTTDDLERLRKFVELYREPVRDYRTCLGVMLSTDLAVLSAKAQDKLNHLFDLNLLWLERVLEHGRQAGTLRFDGNAGAQAHKLLAALQGAQLLARSFRDIKRFDTIAEGLISALAKA
ncbi:TetR family transcriptional regulator [Cohnella sp. CFH 77786]|uniref:TetR/AcrR family transcriptional regulator n=1 Tax=Cohnella sp. CFH 77786 TaxID=2662265 RepID=UPI001C6092D9|nr:TetR/AcrR family transcriptional regulator [Cohnella sp. CFH 77786]MBW5444916.1 TetR family transcriptional regulator [Cohnella sp. CFH 77786]